MIARLLIRPPLAMSPIFIFTVSQPRSLLSIARSSSARSRSRFWWSSQNLMAQTCWDLSARLAPNFRPAFQAPTDYAWVIFRMSLCFLHRPMRPEGRFRYSGAKMFALEGRERKVSFGVKTERSGQYSAKLRMER